VILGTQAASQRSPTARAQSWVSLQALGVTNEKVRGVSEVTLSRRPLVFVDQPTEDVTTTQPTKGRHADGWRGATFERGEAVRVGRDCGEVVRGAEAPGAGLEAAEGACRDPCAWPVEVAVVGELGAGVVEGAEQPGDGAVHPALDADEGPGGAAESCLGPSADHGRLKAWLRPMRGLRQDRNARVIIAGHAFVQNVRRGHYELAAEEPTNRRLAVAFDELAMAIGAHTEIAASPCLAFA
jgi:hypothetical protein